MIVYSKPRALLLLFFTIFPLRLYTQECALPPHEALTDSYDLTVRIDSPYIASSLFELYPTYTRPDNMSLLTADEDIMRFFGCNLRQSSCAPSEVAPLMMIHKNASQNHMLETVEITAVSSIDCIPGLSATGEHVVCVSGGPPDSSNPFDGTFVFRYYEKLAEDGPIVEQRSAEFTIDSNAFLPVHPASLGADENMLLARELQVNVSDLLITPDAERPSYVSIQYKPKSHWNDSVVKADKFIYQAFSAATKAETACNPLVDTDYVRMHSPDASVNTHSDFSLLASGSPNVHFAARYTLAPKPISPLAQRVQNCQQLQAINGGAVLITGDIDCTGQAFAPISLTEPLVLDGGGVHTIRGITISSNSNDVGIFRSLHNDSVLRNIEFENISITGLNNVGIIAGRGSAEFENIRILQGLATGVEHVGGVIGMASSVLMDNTHVRADVAGAMNFGGLVGRSSFSYIDNSSFKGTITGSNNGVGAGGLVGYTNGALIRTSFVEANISAERVAGGLVATSYISGIQNSYFDGDITVASDVAGGLVGWVGGTINSPFLPLTLSGLAVVDSYSAGQVAARNLTGGMAGFVLSDTDIVNSFSSITVTDTEPPLGQSAYAIGGIMSDARIELYVDDTLSCGDVTACLGSVQNADGGVLPYCGRLLLQEFSENSLNWDIGRWSFTAGSHPTLKEVIVSQES